MNFMRLPRCPYCGREFTYREIWRIRKYGEYSCDRCHREFKIRYSNNVYLIVLALLALEVFIFFCFGGIKGELNIFILLLMVVPVTLLYPMLPIMMTLRRKGPPPRMKGRPGQAGTYNPGAARGQRPAGSAPAAAQRRPRPDMPPPRRRSPIQERPLGAAVQSRPEPPRRQESYAPARTESRQAPRRERPAPQYPRDSQRSAGSARHAAGSQRARDTLDTAGAVLKNVWAGALVAASYIKRGAIFIFGYVRIGAIWIADKLKVGGVWTANTARSLWSSLSEKISSGANTQRSRRYGASRQAPYGRNTQQRPVREPRRDMYEQDNFQQKKYAEPEEFEELDWPELDDDDF